MTYSADQLAKLRDEVGLGREVAALLENETFKRVLNNSLHGIQNAWLSEQNRDARESLWQQGAGLQTFIDNLRSIIVTGNMAQSQLDADKKLGGQNEQE